MCVFYLQCEDKLAFLLSGIDLNAFNPYRDHNQRYPFFWFLDTKSKLCMLFSLFITSALVLTAQTADVAAANYDVEIISNYQGISINQDRYHCIGFFCNVGDKIIVSHNNSFIYL